MRVKGGPYIPKERILRKIMHLTPTKKKLVQFPRNESHNRTDKTEHNNQSRAKDDMPKLIKPSSVRVAMEVVRVENTHTDT
jgi:hypothetical protein